MNPDSAKTQNPPPMAAPRVIDGVTVSELAAAFTEWERRYRENPAQFQSESEKLAASADTYGDFAALYFVNILLEKRQP